MYFLDAPTYSHWPAREITPAQEDHTEDKFKKKKTWYFPLKQMDTFQYLSEMILFKKFFKSNSH